MNATMSPIVGASGAPATARDPAAKYTSAGMPLKTTCTTTPTHRPVRACRNCNVASSADRSVNRCAPDSDRPNDFARRAPPTERCSSAIEVRSASAVCTSPLALRRAADAFDERKRKSGATATLTAVRRQSINVIATKVETTIAMLDAKFAAASLTTDCTPDTSLVSRL